VPIRLYREVVAKVKVQIEREAEEQQPAG
jgi:ribosomal protein L9